MAILKKKNLLIRGFSGQYGKQAVLRQQNGKTILSDFPEKTELPPTEAQLVQQERFKKAAAYAKGQMRDPISKAMYEREARKSKEGSAYNVAIQDFFLAPEIEEPTLTAYKGQVDDKITIGVADVDVTFVRVTITTGAGQLVEEGEAVKSEDGRSWIYTATAVNPSPNNYKVVITAEDRPGNRSSKEFAKF